MEMWKNIELLGNNYSASNIGNLKNNKTGRILKTFNYKGYRKKTFNYNGKTYAFFVHRLVLKAFNPIENMDNEIQVHHINHNRIDNRVENLTWVTNKENQQLKPKYKSYDTFKELLIILGDEKLNELLLKQKNAIVI